jgi:hypothetical protein
MRFRSIYDLQFWIKDKEEKRTFFSSSPKMSGLVKQPQPIASLGPNAAIATPSYMSGSAHILLWFVIITLLAWLLLYFLKPTLVQKTNLQGQPTGIADAGKSFLGALVIGVIAALLIWLFKGAGNGLGSYGSGGGNILLWFIIVTLLAWLLLYFLRPTLVQKTNAQGQPTGVADAGKSFLGALLIGLLVALVIWLLRSCK